MLLEKTRVTDDDDTALAAATQLRLSDSENAMEDGTFVQSLCALAVGWTG